MTQHKQDHRPRKKKVLVLIKKKKGGGRRVGSGITYPEELERVW
uniref:Uncharacterized protein MANES_04G015400 n=1 Tax=Rhizophora mucronata TaxID=61149 RepID=A0A2P2IMR4_RHIMU